MKKITEILGRFLCFIQPASRARFRELMNSHCPRTKEGFMKEFEPDLVARSIAEKLYNILLNTWCPLDRSEFVPHLLDEIEKDYGIIDMDLEELIFELVDNYELPQKNIKGNDKEIITVKDLIEFAVAVAANYPLKAKILK